MKFPLRFRPRPAAVCVFVALWLFAPGINNAAAKVRSAPWAHSSSDLPADPAVTFGVLKNGFRFALMENRQPRGRVSMHLIVKAGSLQEDDPQRGAAHYLEHMMFNGSERFEPGEMVKYFQRMGLSFGADANARTGLADTIYDIYLPNGDREDLADGLTILKDFAAGAKLLPAEIDKERDVILSEKRTRDSVGYRTHVATMRFSLPDTRLPARLPIGSLETIAAMDRERLKQYYDTWYRPESMGVVMVGDFDPESAAALIEEAFGPLVPRAVERPDPELGPIEHQGVKPFYHFESEAGKASVSIEVAERLPPAPDSREFRKRKLMVDLANRMLQKRLARLISQASAPFTSARVRSGRFLRRIKFAQIKAVCSPENWSSTLSVLEQALRQGLQFGFGAAELDRVKKDLIAGHERAVEQMATRDSRSLAGSIIGSIRNQRVFQSPLQRRDLYVPLIQEATLAEVDAAFQGQWASGHRLLIVTGNATPAEAGSESGPEAVILAAYEESQKTSVAPRTELAAVAFPYLPEPEGSGRIRRRFHHTGTDTLQVEFVNNLRLNLKSTDFKTKEILFDLSFGSGRADEPIDQPGLAVLSPAVVNESGLGALAKMDLERALAGRHTRLTFRVGQDRFYFRGRSVSGELDLLFQRLRSQLLDPAFRPSAYALAMERYLQRYRSLATSINGAMRLSGNRFLAGGDSRFGLPAVEQFRRLTLQQVAAWVGRALAHAPLELSLVGDFDPDEAIAAAAKYLGTLPPRNAIGSSAHRTLEIVFPQGQSSRLEVDTRIPKALVVLAFPSSDRWDIGRTRRLSLLASLLSDRLRGVIREELGASYSQSARHQPSRAYPGYGLLKASVHVSPDDAAPVLTAAKRIVSEMADPGISQEELDRARLPILTRIKDLKRKNSYWLETVLTGASRHPEQLEWPRTVESDHRSITSEEMSRLAGSVLVIEKAATIVVTPTRAGS